jgi:hypothetical protein
MIWRSRLAGTRAAEEQPLNLRYLVNRRSTTLATRTRESSQAAKEDQNDAPEAIFFERKNGPTEDPCQRKDAFGSYSETLLPSAASV